MIGTYNFDEEVDRRHTNCLKYDFAVKRGMPENILPLWVADMDFRTPVEVTQALIRVAEHGIFGYSEVGEDYFTAVKNWFLTQHDWEIRQEWLVKTPGVVYAIAAAVRAFTLPQDAVLICQPVYYPFMECIRDNGRMLVNSRLIYENGRYTIDFEDIERKIIENRVKLFLLCSPHNPVGRVWTAQELEQIGKICLKHGVLVLSDEIHCDFTYEGYTHTPFAALGERYAQNSIICTAPSKTFNLAGLQISNIFIPDETVRKRFMKEIAASGYSQLNIMGLTACQAAYTYGQEWLRELKAYLGKNLEYVRNFLQAQLPQIRLVEPEGTYLVWLDCTGLSLTDRELETLIIKKAGLWLDSGAIFGKETAQFQRVNIACTAKTLQCAMERLKTAVTGL